MDRSYKIVIFKTKLKEIRGSHGSEISRIEGCENNRKTMAITEEELI